MSLSDKTVSGYRQGEGMRRGIQWLMVGAITSLGGLAWAGQSVAQGQETGHSEPLALSILKNLEVNTFRNSLRPQHYPDGTTLGQVSSQVYEKVEGHEDAYSVTNKEKSWVYSVRVMGRNKEGVRICFTDQNLQGSYLFAKPLQLEKKRTGHYVVIRELAETPACEITRG